MWVIFLTREQLAQLPSLSSCNLLHAAPALNVAPAGSRTYCTLSSSVASTLSLCGHLFLHQMQMELYMHIIFFWPAAGDSVQIRNSPTSIVVQQCSRWRLQVSACKLRDSPREMTLQSHTDTRKHTSAEMLHWTRITSQHSHTRTLFLLSSRQAWLGLHRTSFVLLSGCKRTFCLLFVNWSGSGVERGS